MTIEFNTQFARVDDSLINVIREEILKISHRFKDISRAEVVLKEDSRINPVENKICEIRLSVFGDDLLVHNRSDDFRKATKNVLKELKKLINQLTIKQGKPADIITSTVKV